MRAGCGTEVLVSSETCIKGRRRSRVALNGRWAWGSTTNEVASKRGGRSCTRPGPRPVWQVAITAVNRACARRLGAASMELA